MKFSISLPTGFEGVMYPIPFVEPGDFVRMAQALREARLSLGVGQRPHHQPALRARAVSRQAAELLRAADGAVVLRRGDDDARGRHRARRPADARSVLARQEAATIDQLSNGRLILALGVGAYREEFAAWAPRLAPKARRGEMMDEGLALMRRLFTERRVTHEGKYYAVQRRRDVSQAEARAVRAVGRRPQHGDRRAHRAARRPAGCRAGGRGPSSRSASSR